MRVPVLVAAGLFLLSPVHSPGAEEADPPPVLLRFRVEAPLAFRTTMGPVAEHGGALFTVDLAKLLAGRALSEDRRKEVAEVQGRLDELAKGLEEAFRAAGAGDTMTTLLTRLGEDRIGVKMMLDRTTGEPAAGATEAEKLGGLLRKRLEGTVLLRGEISDSGRVRSFWLEARQKNLLEMLFRLPEAPVRPGDAWELDTALITMGAAFACEESFRTAEVRLASLVPDGEETVAILGYRLAEFVRGSMPGLAGKEPVPTLVATAFVGRGEFLVGAGRWKRFGGRMKVEMAGAMSRRSEEEFVLEPLGEVPPGLLQDR